MPLSGDLDEGGLIFGFTTRGYYKARKLLDPTARSDGALPRPPQDRTEDPFFPQPDPASRKGYPSARNSPQVNPLCFECQAAVRNAWWKLV